MDLRRLLLAVDATGPTPRILEQTATLARHFGSEVIVLHARSASPAGTNEATPETLLAPRLTAAGGSLAGLSVRTLIKAGPTANVIVDTGQQEKADLILMSSHGYTFAQFLLESAGANVLQRAEIPLWTDANQEQPPPERFAIRRVVAAVDFQPHHRRAVDFAVQLAAEYGARLTLAHVTENVRMWGPGGVHVDPQLRDLLVTPAHEQLDHLRRELGVQAELFIGSGDLPEVLAQAVREAQADLLVIGCRPYGGHLRTDGYPVISAVPTPVVSW